MMNPEFFKIVNLCHFETYELTAGDEDREHEHARKKKKKKKSK